MFAARARPPMRSSALPGEHCDSCWSTQRSCRLVLVHFDMLYGKVREGMPICKKVHVQKGKRGKVLTDQKKVKSMGAHTVRSRIADHSAADCDANSAHALDLPPPVSNRNDLVNVALPPLLHTAKSEPWQEGVRSQQAVILMNSTAMRSMKQKHDIRQTSEPLNT